MSYCLTKRPKTMNLQEAELRTQRDVEKNFTELVKTVRESTNQNGEI